MTRLPPWTSGAPWARWLALGSALAVLLVAPISAYAQPGPPAQCRTANVPVPDNDPAGLTDTFAISGSGSAISSLEFYLHLTHSFVGDLRIELTHVDTGTSAVLVDRPLIPGTQFGCSGNDLRLTFADGEALSIESDCDNTTGNSAYSTNGRYRPGDPPADLLAPFHGESLDGTWTLNVADNEQFDTGIIVRWCLDPGTPLASDLTLGKGGAVQPDTSIVYVMTVANAGPANASGIVVTDPLDPCVVYQSDDCGGSQGPPWTWNVGSVPVGGTVDCNLVVDASGCTGTVINSAAITAFDQVDPNPGNEVASIGLVVGVDIPTLDRAGLLLLLFAMAFGALALLRRRA